MSYLGRIAARASVTPSSTSGGARHTPPGETAPGMASQSPLVQFDQRLTFPSFSESPRLSEDGSREGAPLGGLETPRGTAEAAASPSVSSTGSTISRKAIGSFASPSAGTGSLSSGNSEAPSTGVVLPAPPVGSAALKSTPETGVSGSDERALPVSSGPSFAPELEVESDDVPVAAARPRIRTRTTAGEGGAFSPEARPTEGEGLNALAPSARSVFEAIARVDAWVRRSESSAEDAAESSSGSPPAALPTAPLASSALAFVPASYAQAATASELADAPSISIGRLEIEVVPPAPRVVQQSAPRGSTRSGRSETRPSRDFVFAASRPFGWRQR